VLPQTVAPKNQLNTSSQFHLKPMNAPSNDIADLLDMPITPSHKSYQAPSGPIDLLSQDYAPITSTSKKLTLDDLMDPFQTSIRSQPTLSHHHRSEMRVHQPNQRRLGHLTLNQIRIFL
jgi:hypothetical protein